MGYFFVKLENLHFGNICGSFWPKKFQKSILSRSPTITSRKKLENLHALIFNPHFGPVSGPFWLKNLISRSPPQKKNNSILSFYATFT